MWGTSKQIIISIQYTEICCLVVALIIVIGPYWAQKVVHFSTHHTFRTVALYQLIVYGMCTSQTA